MMADVGRIAQPAAPGAKPWMVVEGSGRKFVRLVVFVCLSVYISCFTCATHLKLESIL